MKAKTYRVTKTRGDRIDVYGYTLSAGASHGKMINRNPRTIKALVDNLNKAVNNSAAYEWETIEQDEVLAEFLKMRREIVREIEAEAKGG
jgi:hypothetical protein